MGHNASISEIEKNEVRTFDHRSALNSLHLTLYLVCAVGFMVDVAEIAISTAFGAIFSASSGTDSLSVGLLPALLSAPYVGAVFGAIGFGMLARLLSIRFALTAAMALLALSSIVGSFSPGIEMLIVMRAASGLAIGAFPPLAIAIIAEHCPARWRATVILAVTATGTLGAPLIIYTTRYFIQNPLYGFDGWRAALFFCSFIALAVSLGFAALRRLDNRTSAKPIVASLSDGPSQIARPKVTTYLILPFLYAVVPWAAVGFPLLSGAILIDKGFNLNDALIFVVAMSFGPAIGTVLSGFFIDRISRRSALFSTLVCGALSLILFGAGNHALVLSVSSVIFGMCMGLFIAILSLYATEFYSGERRALATSRLWALNRVSVALSPFALLLLLKEGGAWALLITLAFILSSAAGLIWLAPAGRAGKELD